MLLRHGFFSFYLFFLPACRYWILYVYREPRRNLPKSITAVKLRFSLVKYPDRMIYERALARRWALQSLPKSKLVFGLMTFFAWTPVNFFVFARKSRLPNAYSITENTGSRRLIKNMYIIVSIILVCFRRIHSEQLMFEGRHTFCIPPVNCLRIQYTYIHY